MRFLPEELTISLSWLLVLVVYWLLVLVFMRYDVLIGMDAQ